MVRTRAFVIFVLFCIACEFLVLLCYDGQNKSHTYFGRLSSAPTNLRRRIRRDLQNLTGGILSLWLFGIGMVRNPLLAQPKFPNAFLLGAMKHIDIADNLLHSSLNKMDLSKPELAHED